MSKSFPRSSSGAPGLRVTGRASSLKLTIRDVTKPITLDVEFGGRTRDPWGGERVGFSANGKIDRREFGLTWNQALEMGGVAVGNDVKISLEVEAIKVDRSLK
jgi:polyisoprenoid-binding protein YceI